MKIHIDFETKSLLSVKDVGAYAYAQHPSTDILCAAIAVDAAPVELFTDMALMKERLTAVLADTSVIFCAHNAFFEQSIWRHVLAPKYGFPVLPIDRWRCTAAKAAYMSLPRSLDDASKALNLPAQKDTAGGKVMQKLSRPRRSRTKSETVFWEYDDCPDDFDRLYDYCKQDVEVERQIDLALPDLNAREQRIWFLDQAINFRGLQTDQVMIRQVLAFIDRTVDDLMSEFHQLTNRAVESPSQVAAFRAWLLDNGVDLPNLQAATIKKWLQSPTTPNPVIRRTLEIRQQLSKISTSKYTAMLDRADPIDGKLRDLLLYHAALTGRWGGRGVQPQNLPRGSVNSDVAIQHILQGDYDWFRDLYSDPMAVYSSCVRGAFTASPGNELLVGDFSSIEAMTLPWLAGQTDTLDIFRQGRDIYCEEARAIFGRPVTKKNKYERSVGKVAVLALGYQGGIGAFGTMARGYGVSLKPAYEFLWGSANGFEREKAEYSYEFYAKKAKTSGADDPLDRESALAADIIKQRWRRKNDGITKWWNDLEQAAIWAIRSGDKQFVGGTDNQPEIVYGMIGPNLLCRLPSGSCLVYPFARLSESETPFGDVKTKLTYSTQNSMTHQFQRESTYGGKLAENITQAVARDLLADAMLRLDGAGYSIVLHVHDEVVCDEPVGSKDLADFERIMSAVPQWAEGIPIKVEAWKGIRYRK